MVKKNKDHENLEITRKHRQFCGNQRGFTHMLSRLSEVEQIG